MSCGRTISTTRRQIVDLFANRGDREDEGCLLTVGRAEWWSEDGADHHSGRGGLNAD